MRREAEAEGETGGVGGGGEEKEGIKWKEGSRTELFRGFV